MLFTEWREKTDLVFYALEAKPVPLSRRLSKMAQTLTSRIKETNKKQQPKAAVEEEEPTVINETAAVPEVTPAPLPGANPSLPVPASAWLSSLYPFVVSLFSFSF